MVLETRPGRAVLRAELPHERPDRLGLVVLELACRHPLVFRHPSLWLVRHLYAFEVDGCGCQCGRSVGCPCHHVAFSLHTVRSEDFAREEGRKGIDQIGGQRCVGYDQRFRVNRLGNDTIVIVSPQGLQFCTCDPDVIVEVASRREDFCKPVESYVYLDM